MAAGGLVSQQDAMDLAKLEALQSFIEQMSKIFGERKTILSSFKTNSNELKIIIDQAAKLFLEDFRTAINKSVTVAEWGETVASDALSLCNSMDKAVSTAELQKFIGGTLEIARKAKKDAEQMVNDFRLIRQGIFALIDKIKKKTDKNRSVGKNMVIAANGLKKALEKIMVNLEQQEKFITILVNWWTRVQAQLRHTEESLLVLEFGATLRQQQIRGCWEDLRGQYNLYISSISQLQDRYPILRVEAGDGEWQDESRGAGEVMVG